MKEELRFLWKQVTKQAAERLLDNWCRRAGADQTDQFEYLCNPHLMFLLLLISETLCLRG